jgi:hypothetical protein
MQYDGVATVNDPPHTASFDPANCRSSLGPRNRAQSSASSSSAEISALSAVSSLFSSVVSFMRPDHVLPSTPNIHNKLASSVVTGNTPPAIFNTPSKLERFLHAAEGNGIPGVVSFHAELSEKGYGPDIMHLVNVSDLVDVGMPPGDAIRLKEFASRWWTDERRHASKRQRPRDVETIHNTAASTSAIPLPAEMTPSSKRLRFEKRFNDGGGMTIYGPGVKSGSCEDEDYTWWLYSKDLKMYVPLPMDKVPILPDY